MSDASAGTPAGDGLSVDGTRLRLAGAPFRFRGLSFFNALFNPTFNRDDDTRREWVVKFWDNGVTALRVWCQWDFAPPNVFADVGPGQSLFLSTGELDHVFADRLAQLAAITSEHGMALEVTLFSHERNPNLAVGSLAKGATNVTELLFPYRNVLVQIWNESNANTERFYDLVKSVDPHRLVTNSPGFSDDLGDERHNRLMDVLTPHTVRQPPARFWVDGPHQVSALLDQYGKPVIDDEPARCGLVRFGGIAGGTTAAQHVAHLRGTEAAGGYYTYHHDMFQGGYRDPATPPHGIPDPDFNSFHREVFDALVGE